MPLYALDDRTPELPAECPQTMQLVRMVVVPVPSEYMALAS